VVAPPDLCALRPTFPIGPKVFATHYTQVFSLTSPHRYICLRMAPISRTGDTRQLARLVFLPLNDLTSVLFIRRAAIVAPRPWMAQHVTVCLDDRV
jgi:hypothetical protein